MPTPAALFCWAKVAVRFTSAVKWPDVALSRASPSLLITPMHVHADRAPFVARAALDNVKLGPRCSQRLRNREKVSTSL